MSKDAARKIAIGMVPIAAVSSPLIVGYVLGGWNGAGWGAIGLLAVAILGLTVVLAWSIGDIWGDR